MTIKFPASTIHFNVMHKDEREQWVYEFVKRTHGIPNPDLTKCAFVGYNRRDGTYIEVRNTADGWIAYETTRIKQ